MIKYILLFFSPHCKLSNGVFRANELLHSHVVLPEYAMSPFLGCNKPASDNVGQFTISSQYVILLWKIGLKKQCFLMSNIIAQSCLEDGIIPMSLLSFCKGQCFVNVIGYNKTGSEQMKLTFQRTIEAEIELDNPHPPKKIMHVICRIVFILSVFFFSSSAVFPNQWYAYPLWYMSTCHGVRGNIE